MRLDHNGAALSGGNLHSGRGVPGHACCGRSSTTAPPAEPGGGISALGRLTVTGSTIDSNTSSDRGGNIAASRPVPRRPQQHGLSGDRAVRRREPLRRRSRGQPVHRELDPGRRQGRRRRLGRRDPGPRGQPANRGLDDREEPGPDPRRRRQRAPQRVGQPLRQHRRREPGEVRRRALRRSGRHDPRARHAARPEPVAPAAPHPTASGTCAASATTSFARGCAFNRNSDIRTARPGIGAFALNGAETKTFSIRRNSPAVDAGSARCTPRDQRNRPRRRAVRHRRL